MLPLTCFTLSARELPPDMSAPTPPASFVLPGAKALEGFADLLGGGDLSESECAKPETADEPESAPFSLPAMLPDDLSGPVSLRRTIDFGALRGNRAVLTLDHVVGSGRILLGESLLCRFDSIRMGADAMHAARAMTAQPCMLAVDLSDALELGRKETLLIEFDEARPAGLPGPVLLHVTCGAHMSGVSLQPDSRQKSVAVSAQITAAQPGRYVLRAQAATCPGEPAREISLRLQKGETRQASFCIPLPAHPFVPGVPHDAAAVALRLFSREEQGKGDGLLCDSAVLMCGYAPRMPEYWLPLDQSCMRCDPEQIAQRLRSIHMPAVSLPSPAPDGLYRALCRAGVAVRQHMPPDHPLRQSLTRLPCVLMTDQIEPDMAISLEASAWQLCSMVSSPRALDHSLSPRELLFEAAGFFLDPGDEGVRAVLAWLHVLSIRLHAEAARQGRFHGALCSAEEWKQPDIEAALRTAFSPLHLSVLPMRGAWWTGTRFFASLEAFIPAHAYESGAPLRAQAVLEDDEGHALCTFDAPCPCKGGHVGVMEAALPDHPCVLELTVRLTLRDQLIEEGTLPVYVGERGPLEAAFQ